MNANDLRAYVHKLSVEKDKMEEYLMDVAIYSDGAITFSELVVMPINKIQMFEKRLSEKMKAKSGNKTEYL